jgi:hypothetical protein
LAGAGGGSAEGVCGGVVVAEWVGLAVEVDDYGPMQVPVEHGGGHGGVAEDVATGNWRWHMFVVADFCC